MVSAVGIFPLFDVYLLIYFGYLCVWYVPDRHFTAVFLVLFPFQSNTQSDEAINYESRLIALELCFSKKSHLYRTGYVIQHCQEMHVTFEPTLRYFNSGVSTWMDP